MTARATGGAQPRKRTKAATEPAAPVPDAPARTVLATVAGIECTAPDGEQSFGAALTFAGNLLRMRRSAAEIVLVQHLIGLDVFLRLVDAGMGRQEWRVLADAASRHAFGVLDEEANRGN